MFSFKIFLPELSGRKKDIFQRLKGYSGQKRETILSHIYFNESFFGLDKSSLWNELSPFTQNKVLEGLSQEIIQELLQIEISGMAYASKMSLLSRNLDERQMFCEFSSQEARHFESIRPFLSNSKNLYSLSSFSQFISQIVEKSNFMEGLLLIQTALEGWGINYYKDLMRSSQNQDLQGIFKGILRDEVKHHASGMHVMGERQGLDFLEKSPLSKVTLQEMLMSIAMGPISLVIQVFSNVPHANKKMIKKFLVDIEAQETSNQKMKVMLTLLEQALEPSALELFKPFCEIWSTSKMAEYASDQLGIQQSFEPSPDHSLS